MNRQEATSIVEERLGPFRKRSYAELQRMVDGRTVEAGEAAGPSGTKYQIEIQAFWDDKPGANIRVRSCIDNGGWRAFFPLTRDFIMTPTGSFIGE